MDQWLNLSMAEIIIRLLLSIIASGLIGFDREYKSRPAGLRTHVLVGVAACLLALIQEHIAIDITQIAREYTGDTPFPVSADRSRLIAQIVSGIGFLGAGTIIVTKQTVSGLTTAASLWATAALGIGFGMGIYPASLITTAIIMVALTLLKYVIHVPERVQVEIRFTAETYHPDAAIDIFDRYHLKYRLVRHVLDQGEGLLEQVYVYHVTLNKHFKHSALVESLLSIPNIKQIKGQEL